MGASSPFKFFWSFISQGFSEEIISWFHADSHHLIPLIIVKTSFQLFILTGKNLLCSFCKTNLNLYSCVINQKIWKNKFAFKRKRGWMSFQNLAWYLESSSPHTILYNLLSKTIFYKQISSLKACNPTVVQDQSSYLRRNILYAQSKSYNPMKLLFFQFQGNLPINSFLNLFSWVFHSSVLCFPSHSLFPVLSILMA